MTRTVAYWLLIGFSLVGLVGGILLLPLHFSLLQLLTILTIFGGLPLPVAVWLGRRIPQPALRLPHALLIVVVAAGCLVSLRSIQAFPNLSATDEAMNLNYVDSFRRTGTFAMSLAPYDAPIVISRFGVYAVTAWTSVFPNDVFALRAFSTLGGFALLAVVFLVGRALDDILTGGIAAALLATNLLWMAVSHVARQDIWLAVFVWAAVWLALEARKRKATPLAIAAGIVVAVSADVHPLGAYACVALGVWWLYTLRSRLLVAFVFGGLLGTACYGFAHILPDPAQFLAALRAEATSNGAEGWSPLAAMLARHLKYLLANPLEIGLLVAGSVWALHQRRTGQPGVFLGVLLLLYALTAADPNLYYPIVWVTGMVILTAVALRRVSWRWHAPLGVAFAAAFALNIVLVERHIRAEWNGRALAALQQVAAHVPPGQRGTGETVLYLALRDPRYTGFTFVNFRAADLGVTRWEVVETLQPDWIVTMQDEEAFTPAFDVLSVEMPHMRLEIPDAALAQAYRLTDTVVTSVGVFEIWQRA